MDIKTYAQLSAHVYHKELKDNRMTIPNEFKKLSWKKDDPISGFSAGAYQNTVTNEIVIAFAGTNEQYNDHMWLDWKNNIEMGLGAGYTIDTESQFVQAIKFVLQVMEKHPNTPISFTGHSLGGGLASAMSVLFDRPAYIFDPAPFKSTLIHCDYMLKAYQILQKDNAKISLSGSLSNYFEVVKQADNIYTAKITQWVGIPNEVSIRETSKIKAQRREYIEEEYNKRENGVKSWYTEREFLDYVRSVVNVVGIESNKHKVELTSKQTLGPIGRHSINLLQAFIERPEFHQAINKTPISRALELIFDSKLYAADTPERDTFHDFMIRMVQQQAGGFLLNSADADTSSSQSTKIAKKDILGSFATDLDQLGQLGDSFRAEAILAQMIEWYYYQAEDGKYDGVNHFFDNMIGGVLQYNTARSEGKGKVLGRSDNFVKEWLSNIYSRDTYKALREGVDKRGIGINISRYNDDFSEYINKEQWTVAMTTGGNTALDKNKTQMMVGSQYDDEFVGGEKNDVLIGGKGSDTLKGGAGKDDLYASTSKDDSQATGLYSDLRDKGSTNHLYGGLDEDRLYGGAGEDYLYGGDDEEGANDNSTDYLYGGSGSDKLYGGAGNDQLYGGKDSDTLKGGADNDFLYAGSDKEGTDTADSDADKLYGGAGSDHLYGGKGNDTLYGGNDEHGVDDTSADYLYGGAGSDKLYGGAGNDFLYAGNDERGAGTTLRDRDALYGGVGDDHLYGGLGNDVLYGDNDEDSKGGGSDYLYGGLGSDELYGGSGDDYLYAGYNERGGADASSENTLKGGAGNDHLYGDAGNDKLFGGDDNDTLRGNGGWDIYDGGDGFDTYETDGIGTIRDSDGKGSIKVKGKILTGGKHNEEKDPQYTYYGGGNTYYWKGSGKLLINGKLEVENFKNGDLGIRLKNEDEEELFPPHESTPSLREAEMQSSPIVLDLNRDGVVGTTPLADSLIWFDLDNNGFKEHTAWVDKGDGLLALDLDSNGQIDHGGELFGNYSLLPDGSKARNGFEALKQYDSNRDGVLDAGDERWQDFRIWRDADGNGVSEGAELQSLDEAGIRAIDLAYTESDHRDIHGNSHKQRGSIQWRDGQTGLASDVWFETNPVNTAYQTKFAHSKEVKGLPEIWAFGNVLSLRDAMSQDAELLTLVKSYVTTENPSAEQLDQLIYRWVGVENVPSGSRGGSIDARKLAALETLTGRQFRQIGSIPNPGPNAANVLKYEYDKFASYTAAHISLQSQSSELAHHLKVYRDESGRLVFDWTEMKQYLFRLESSQGMEVTVGALKTLLSALNYNDTLSNRFKLEITDFFSSVWPQEKAWLTLSAATGFAGDNGRNHLLGTQEANILFGDAGDDFLYGGDGDDILIGGAGNDRLEGGNGADTYVFGKGFGQDTVYDDGDNSADTLRFTEGWKASDFNFIRNGNDLLIQAKAGEEQVQVYDYFAHDSAAPYAVDQIEFDDGTKLDIAAIKVLVQQGSNGNDNLYAYAGGSTLSGLDGNDYLYGASGKDTLYGNDGNDTLFGDAGDDSLYGDDGDDTLHGDDGNDTLIGGAGNDRLEGGYDGADTYVFAKGHGQDIVDDFAEYLADGFDTLRFEGAVSSDAIFTRSGNDLVVKAYGGTDQVKVKDYFTDRNRREFRFAFDDQTLESNSLTITYNGTDRDDVIRGSELNEVITGGAGNDMLIGGGERDTYVFAKGHGQDTVDDSTEDRYYSSILRFEGAVSSDAVFTRSGNDLLIRAYGGDDQVLVKHFYLEAAEHSYWGYEFVFDDRVWGNGYWEGFNIANNGTDQDDTIQGIGLKEIINGGAGNDTLIGGGGEDTYVFAKGHGQDTVVDWSETARLWQYVQPELKTLRFEGAVIADAVFDRSGNDLIIRAYGGKDQVTLPNYFKPWLRGSAKISHFQFIFDDRTLSPEDMHGLTIAGEGTDRDEDLHGFGGNDILYGGAGNDYLMGYKGDDVLSGGTGDDELSGGDGSDILNGGSGNDILIGGEGSDTYRFAAGHGQDIVEDYAENTDESNILCFEGALVADTAFIRRDNDLVVRAYGTEDEVLLPSYFSGYGDSRYRFVFDNRTLQPQDIDSLLVVESMPADKVWTGSLGNDTILGGDGNDQLTGGGGSDIFNGGAGNDELKGNNNSADTYLFSRGHGRDRIYDSAEIGNQSDTLHFEGAHAADAVFSRSGEDLVIRAYGGEDQVTLLSYFQSNSTDSSRYRVNLAFDDRTIEHFDYNQYAAQANGLIQAMAGFGGDGGGVSATAAIPNQANPLLAATSV